LIDQQDEYRLVLIFGLIILFVCGLLGGTAYRYLEPPGIVASISCITPFVLLPVIIFLGIIRYDETASLTENFIINYLLFVCVAISLRCGLNLVWIYI
jgi:hypothetical protein